MTDASQRGNLEPRLRIAVADDVPAIDALQKASLAALGAAFYVPEVLGSAIAHVSVVDRRLIELGATLSGEAFYLRHGYRKRERIESTLADGTRFAVVMMTKRLP